MERASRLIAKLAQPGGAATVEELARAAWPGAVGPKIAAHSRAVRMVRASLIVETEDVIWQRQLFALRGQILRNLERHLGPGLVKDVEFRASAVVRRGPGSARQSAAALPADDAERIADPVLRHIYKSDRKKALA